MTSIIFRYLSSEVFKSSLATMLVLFIILMSNTFSGVLEDIALGEVPEKALMPLLLRQATSLIVLLIPFGFFLGVVLAFGRLYKDYEMPVLNSCGLGYRQMLQPIMVLMLPFFAVALYFSLSLSAASQRYAQSTVDSFEQKDEFEQIVAGRFNVSDNGSHVFYMESMSKDRSQLKNVIINQSNADMFSFGIAESGVQVKDNITGDLFLELRNGVRYEGFPGAADFKVIEYEANGILIDIQPKTKNKKNKVTEKPFLELLGSDTKKDKIELQWRLATPFSLLILGLIAVPLSYVAPRNGRYGKMGVAILVYILYNNALGTMLVWIEKDIVAVEYGFWIVHTAFLMLALFLVLKRNRRFTAFRFAR